jgi:hypothetical protein
MPCTCSASLDLGSRCAGSIPTPGRTACSAARRKNSLFRPSRLPTSKGFDCHGPLPPDTIFLKASRGAFDLVVAMHHDQGHIPMKLLDFEQTVNVSLGIPIIRTSVDHGTAFDIAGLGQADSRNMKAALRLGVQMARGRRRNPWFRADGKNHLRGLKLCRECVGWTSRRLRPTWRRWC